MSFASLCRVLDGIEPQQITYVAISGQATIYTETCDDFRILCHRLKAKPATRHPFGVTYTEHSANTEPGPRPMLMHLCWPHSTCHRVAEQEPDLFTEATP